MSQLQDNLLLDNLRRLYALAPRGRMLGLDRMQEVCAKLGDPQDSFEIVHIAGTNGKGSVSAFTASMLKAAKIPCGLYTSPHLVRFAERIQIDGEPISDETLSALLEEVFATGVELSFFEAATVTAFLAFRQAGVKIAVLEVGLGGRLDATNIAKRTKVAPITRISYDHTAELGNTITAIATEKAAIIKAGCAVVCGKLHPDAKAVVEARAQEVGARILPLKDPEPFPGAELAYPRMAMYGTNLAVATTIGRELGLSAEQIAHGIERTNWPGRNELLHRNGEDLTLLDCAHNPDAAVALSHIVDASLIEAVGNRRNVALVFGALESKNWKATLDRLEHIASHRVYVKAAVAKGVEPYHFVDHLPGEIAEDIPAALEKARAIVGARGLVVITGSVFVVGPARAYLLDLPLDPPIDL